MKEFESRTGETIRMHEFTDGILFLQDHDTELDRLMEWKTAGYDEDGGLIQINRNTGEFRKLDKWVVIFKTPTKEND